ncbi:OpgC domain-containing protein [Rhodoblastus acidophilus]|uniref:OpgC domain-containing protein n=1 Tax=Candidatus Rhodoblastus alkanivorans TaxID=2954117 RepID=A0ABS9Z7E3_9HYPH|nr:OpgC domain-containing protein [Candidatus Rhodoblastus alkanivorans]MCI4680731.1 OpgC domain-containing protein [Candidatus Rhodoblastus alkanivorans]MCI4683360.1 OpgC domain-containing protein [Candidatus Rhodoblastus alkanivorans]MDI4640672.1 OpgC domain-containing protein [Rhodoblastus acidophilus]
MRAPNAVDFWRGFALATIFINHIPGIFLERYSFRHYSLSDAAELFVLLAGVALRYVSNSLAKEPMSAAVYRLAGRALTIYFAQLVITAIAIAILAGGAKALDQPYILQWNNAAAIFEDPVNAHIGLALLRYQLGFFDILPLYVVLMAMGPSIAIIDRYAPRLLLPLSFALYVYTLATGLNLPTWPVEGAWYFSPFAWQFIFILGFVLSGPRGYQSWSPRVKKILFWLAGIQTLVGGGLALAGIAPDPSALPDPKLFFVFDKTYLSPALCLHALALACFFMGAFKYIDRFARPLVGYLALLGRNSLHVFCAGSLLSLTGQIVRYRFNGRFEIDVVVILVGWTVMGVVAWLSEWRKRHAVARAQRLASA